MDKKYYIPENGKLIGPFSPEELRERSLRSDTRVYVEGGRFLDAKDYPELADCITAEPEPTLKSGELNEKEVLLSIMKHLEELRIENGNLRNEIAALREENDKLRDSLKRYVETPGEQGSEVDYKQPESLELGTLPPMPGYNDSLIPDYNENFNPTYNKPKKSKHSDGSAITGIFIIGAILLWIALSQ